MDQQFRTDACDVIAPEDGFELGQVGFVEVDAGGGGFDVDAAYFDVELIGFGVDDDVGTVDGQLFVDAVADGEGEGQHRGDGGGSEQDRDAGEGVTTGLGRKAVEEEGGGPLGGLLTNRRGVLP